MGRVYEMAGPAQRVDCGRKKCVDFVWLMTHFTCRITACENTGFLFTAIFPSMTKNV